MISTSRFQRALVGSLVAIVCGASSDAVRGESSPFAPSPSSRWSVTSSDGWIMHSAPYRMPVRSRSSHSLAKDAFGPVAKGHRLSASKFKTLFREHPSSAPNQAALVDELYEVIRNRRAQVDIFSLAHNVQTNTVVTCFVLLPRINVRSSERPTSFPIGAWRVKAGSWAYFVPNQLIQDQLSSMMNEVDGKMQEINLKEFADAADNSLEQHRRSVQEGARRRNTMQGPVVSRLAHVPSPSFTASAEKQLSARIAVRPSRRDSETDRAYQARDIRGGRIDVVVAERVDDAGGLVEVTDRQLKAIRFDDIWRGFRNQIKNEMCVLSLDVGAPRPEPGTALAVVHKYFLALKEGDHVTVLKSIEEGPWQERYRGGIESPINDGLRKMYYEPWKKMTVLFELPVVVGAEQYSVIYYQIHPEDKSEGNANQLDVLFVKRNSEGEWVLTEDPFSSRLFTIRDALPRVRYKTASEVRTLILAYPQVSAVYRDKIRPRLLSINK